ncbi:MAG: inositol monophosphatase [Gammaproteobacteria bacterium]|nr:inositol monophosphatase [Gammaproteobacteria bacterium]MBU1703933.1 inositol monophosphatase [Nanoarchaeota archaeon]
MKETAIKAAKEAGKILLENFDNVKKITSKGKNNFVTNVDIKAEKKIMAIIKNRFPKHSFLCEESGCTRKEAEYEWVIDPLDGTHNYMHGLPLFGTSIGLKKDGETVLGVIYMPLMDRIFVAEKGKGAFMNGKRIHVSSRKKLSQAFILYDSNIHRLLDIKFDFLKSLSNNIFSARMLGCAVVNATNIAMGNADGYIAYDPFEWDFLAGHLIMEEAGGIADKVRFGKNVAYISGNRAVVAALKQRFSKILSR